MFDFDSVRPRDGLLAWDEVLCDIGPLLPAPRKRNLGP